MSYYEAIELACAVKSTSRTKVMILCNMDLYYERDFFFNTTLGINKNDNCFSLVTMAGRLNHLSCLLISP